jgi:7SK snRNA methylphosphate capping enzyme
MVDPRVAAMPAEWFAGLRCLDVGCNAGHVTVAIGLHYKPLEILGVDIDRQLIAKARDNLARVSKAIATAPPPPLSEGGVGDTVAASASATASAPGSGAEAQRRVSAALALTPRSVPRSVMEWNRNGLQSPPAMPVVKAQATTASAAAVDASATVGPDAAEEDAAAASGGQFPFPENMWFRRQDYTAPDGCTVPIFNTILCLSVTKWVHLHHGDQGIKALFHKMFDSLVPGGRLVLEPQPFKSYKAKYRNADQVSSQSAALNDSGVRMAWLLFVDAVYPCH